MIADSRPPLVTVAMPVFNGGSLLRPAVLSMVQQTFPDWELLIIDDGSSDGSLESIQDIQDARIRVLRDGSNKGLAARLNEAIDLARGCYFARMDQDDISYPERFAYQVAALEKDTSLDLVGTRAIAISPDDRIIGYFLFDLNHSALCAKPWRGFYMMHPTWMGRIEWFRLHRYATPGPFLCEDQELLLRSFNTSRFGIVAEILFAYRVRSRVAWQKTVKTRWSVLKMQAHHFMRTRQLVYGLLAVFVFVGRVAMDLLNAIFQVWHVPLFVRYRGNVDVATVAKWCDVQKRVRLLP